MKTRLVFLLTRDPEFEQTLRKALRSSGADILQTTDLGEALEVICRRGGELDLAVIDFPHCCHGMTLLAAIKACRLDLPVIVVTAGDVYHAATLAYANQAAVCLAKPVPVEELESIIAKLNEPKLELTNT